MMPPAKKLRRIKSCQPCRQLKRRCDGERPCGTCVRYHHHCQYPTKPEGLLNLSSTSDSPVALHQGASKDSTTRTSQQSQAELPDNSILDPIKDRYLDTSSAVAAARLLGIQLGAAKAPRLHSFAWNVGLRPDTLDKPRIEVTNLFSFNNLTIYANAYFATVSPTFEILDKDEFFHRAQSRWEDFEQTVDANFDAVACGVVALGSLCSDPPDREIEAAAIAFAKERLETVGLTRMPKVDIIAGWILRSIYLRATSRPHACWMASVVTMHLIQALGLHREQSSIAMIYPSMEAASSYNGNDRYRRRTFWVAHALHAMWSYGYSRPRVTFNGITIARLDSDHSSQARDLLRLAELIPQDTQACVDLAHAAEARALVEAIVSAPDLQMPVSLFAADISFAAYRHLRGFIPGSSLIVDSTISQIIAIGSRMLDVVHTYISSRRSPVDDEASPCVTHVPWWSLASCPFQFLLILLSVSTSNCLAAVPRALQTLRTLRDVYDTHMVREAEQTATMLTRLAHMQKNADAALLKRALGESISHRNNEHDGIPPQKQRSQQDQQFTQSVSFDDFVPPARGSAQTQSNGISGLVHTKGHDACETLFDQSSLPNQTGNDWYLNDGLDLGDTTLNADQIFADGNGVDWNAVFDNMDWV